MATSREAIAAIALLNPPTLGDRRQRWNLFGKPSPPCSYPDAKRGKMTRFVNTTGPPNGNDTVVLTFITKSMRIDVRQYVIDMAGRWTPGISAETIFNCAQNSECC